jgi:hypothetical protein
MLVTKQQRVAALSSEDGREIAAGSRHDALATRIALSPDQQLLTSTSVNGWARIWDMAPFLHPPRKGRRTAGPLAAFTARGRRRWGAASRAGAEGLPPSAFELEAARACAALCGLGRSASLGLLADLATLLGGASADGFASLTARPGLRMFAGLGFPLEARAGLCALLIGGDGYEDWVPPASALPARLFKAIEDAVKSPVCEPAPLAPRLSRPIEAADAINERLIALLRVAGPKAVALQ